MGSDLHQRGDNQQRRPISIHAPAWGATPSYTTVSKCFRYFNPRSRMGSDACSTRIRYHRNISIHAPAWGATLAAAFLRVTGDISIHAPAWGATDAPRPVTQLVEISIHAPAWGATRHRVHHAPARLFQSTLPHGERLATPVHHAVAMLFQSTLPHGERLRYMDDITIYAAFQSTLPHGERRRRRHPVSRTPADFNPRSRMGSDRSGHVLDVPGLPISIHAPAWGATSMGLDIESSEGFQSTLPHGERLEGRQRWKSDPVISIHAPAWGATVSA